MVKPRSSPENRYYWAVVIEMVWGMFTEFGNDLSKEEVNNYLKVHVGKLFKDVHDKNGEVKKTLRSSSDLTTVEFEDYMSKIRSWASTMGCFIPEPNSPELRQIADDVDGKGTE